MKTVAAAPLARPDLAGPGLRASFNIAEKWELTAGEARCLLGAPGRATFARWKRDRMGTVPADVLERISYILGMYKALHLLFGDRAQADGWVRRPNAALMFGGRSALDRMLAGQVADLYVVRQYLEGQRGST